MLIFIKDEPLTLMAESMMSGKQVWHPGSSQAASWRENTNCEWCETSKPTFQLHTSFNKATPPSPSQSTNWEAFKYIHTAAVLGMETHLKSQQLEDYGRRVVSSRQDSAI